MVGRRRATRGVGGSLPILGPAGARIDLAGYRVWFGGEPVPLTPKERQLLECLASRQGAVVPRRELIALVGEQRSRTLDVYICRLRRKLHDQGAVFIQTVRKVGYRLNASRAPGAGPALGPAVPLA